MIRGGERRSTGLKLTGCGGGGCSTIRGLPIRVFPETITGEVTQAFCPDCKAAQPRASLIDLAGRTESEALNRLRH